MIHLASLLKKEFSSEFERESIVFEKCDETMELVGSVMFHDGVFMRMLDTLGNRIRRRWFAGVRGAGGTND